MLKGHLSKTSGSQFHKWLSGPEKFSGLSRNGPQDPSGVFSISWVLSIRRNFRKFRVGIKRNGIFSGKDFRKFRTTFSVFPKVENSVFSKILVFYSKSSGKNVLPSPSVNDILLEENGDCEFRVPCADLLQ